MDKRGSPNFHFIWYEDVRKDMAKVIRELAKFLERDISEEDVQLLQENMKKENFKWVHFIGSCSFIGRRIAPATLLIPIFQISL